MIPAQIITNIFISGSIYLLISISYTVIYYPTKFFHLAHASVITLGAYATFFFVRKELLPLAISVILAILIASLIGILCEVIIYRPMRKNNLPTLAYLIVSIGLYVILQNCISLYFGDDTKVIRVGRVEAGHRILGAYITAIQIITIIVSILFYIFLTVFLKFTKTGKSIRAVASNSELCNIYGINSEKVILIAFGIGSVLAATAGILSAMDTNMTPKFGFNLLLYGVVSMIIGGVGSTRGLIAGSLLVASAQHLAAYYIESKWMDATAYVILVLFLIWKPLGFSGKLLKKVEV